MEEDVERLGTIKGIVPQAYNFPRGCRFSDRCPYVMEKCLTENPSLFEIGQNHEVRCYLYEEGGNKDDKSTKHLHTN